MPSFTSSPVASVLPKTNKTANPGVRKAAFQAMLSQVQTLVDTDENDTNRPALIVELDETDKPITIRNQINRAAAQLGITMYVRRRGSQVIAYKTGMIEPVAPVKPGRKAKK